MIYLIIFFLLLILSYRYDYCQKQEGRKFWIIVSILIFIILAGLRYRIGTDSIRYETYFVRDYPTLNHLGTSDFQNSRFAPLFIILNSAVKTFTDDFMVFQFVHATIVCSVIGWFFMSQTRKVFLAFTLFYVFMYLTLLTEVLRESLAACVFLLAWPSFRDGKWWQWYLWSIIGVLFHTSAIMMFVLPIICIPGIRELFIFGRRTAFICIIVLLLSVAVQMMFFKYVQALAITENVAERAEVYSKIDLGNKSLNPLGMIGQTVRYILYPLIALFFLTKDKKLHFIIPQKSFDKKVGFVLIGIYVAIFSVVIPIITRYTNYFFFFTIIILCNFAYKPIPIHNKLIRFKYMIWILFFIPMITAQFYIGYMSGVGKLKAYMPYYPYATRIDMQRDPDREKWFTYQRAW